jgi:redox-sensitive bicupin YhaK (pirin superfamily)
MAMPATRKIRKTLNSRPTLEGAGVHLRRGFGNQDVPLFDPFLLFDDFRSDRPEDYLAGFPWHPHRGIETITYVLQGEVEHADSMKNHGTIGSGDAQWMTAGSGIIHHEMPKGDAEGRMYGFQLWANLPRSHKMMGPRYRDVKASEIPRGELPGGVVVRVLAGTVAGRQGPVRDIVTDPEYLDVGIPAGSAFTHPTRRGHTVFAYVFEGKGVFGDEGDKPLGNGTVVLFEDGDQVVVKAQQEAVRFLLVSGKPIGEPVAWSGPIVMNTQEELETAFEEYENGTFIK